MCAKLLGSPRRNWRLKDNWRWKDNPGDEKSGKEGEVKRSKEGKDSKESKDKESKENKDAAPGRGVKRVLEGSGSHSGGAGSGSVSGVLKLAEPEPNVQSLLS